MDTGATTQMISRSRERRLGVGGNHVEANEDRIGRDSHRNVGVTTWGILGTAVAQKAAVLKLQDELAIGEDQVKRLLPLMDHDKDGNVSKQEFMRFMEDARVGTQ